MRAPCWVARARTHGMYRAPPHVVRDEAYRVSIEPREVVGNNGVRAPQKARDTSSENPSTAEPGNVEVEAALGE